MHHLIVTESQDRSRLDHLLNEASAAPSRSQLGKWIDEGLVRVNQQIVSKAGHKLRAGDKVEWDIPQLRSLNVAAEQISLDIVYEDADLLVINKPVGLVVHPGAGHASGTLVNALLYHCHDLSGIGGIERPGIVHRLDKDTSGLLVVAKHDQAHHSLQQQLQARRMKRCYYALAEHGFAEEQGTVEAPIGRHPVERQRMAVVPDGRFARTHWQVIKKFKEYTWLALELDTGRTHQIRVHLRHLQHPLAGDPIYGSRRKHPFKVERPLLHAYKLSFEHPVTREAMCFEAPLPADFAQVLAVLERLR